MNGLTKQLPVRKWVINLKLGSDAELACEGWLTLIRAQGWSPVGEPEYVEQEYPEHGEVGQAVVFGRYVEHPDLTIADGLTAIEVPA